MGTYLASRAVGRDGALRISGEPAAGGGCFSGGFTALAEGTQRNYRQEGKQCSRNYKNKVLTCLSRCISSASMAGRLRYCSLEIPSSCGAV